MKKAFSDLTLAEAIPLLKDIGSSKNAEALDSILASNPEFKDVLLDELPQMENLQNISWRGSEHVFGFIEIDSDNNDFYTVKSATTLDPDNSLKGQLINIKLGSLYTMNYPGLFGGRHNVLMHFNCKHVVEDTNDTATIEFDQKFSSREGEGAGNLGDFIFIGLKVPNNGLQFEVKTVNISNDNDEAALKVLESDTIKDGLNLINASLSMIAPFTTMAQGLFELLLSGGRNKVVQKFTIGFDFDTNVPDIAKLKVGTYVAVQAKKDELLWDDWIYQRSKALIVNKNNNRDRLPYNYITFNVTKHVS